MLQYCLHYYFFSEQQRTSPSKSELSTVARCQILPKQVSKVFVEVNLPLRRLLNFSLPQFPGCRREHNINMCIYTHNIHCVYKCTHTSHLGKSDVRSMCLFACTCLIEQMMICITEKLRDLPPKKVNERLNNQSQITGVLTSLP